MRLLTDKERLLLDLRSSWREGFNQRIKNNNDGKDVLQLLSDIVYENTSTHALSWTNPEYGSGVIAVDVNERTHVILQYCWGRGHLFGLSLQTSGEIEWFFHKERSSFCNWVSINVLPIIAEYLVSKEDASTNLLPTSGLKALVAEVSARYANTAGILDLFRNFAAEVGTDFPDLVVGPHLEHHLYSGYPVMTLINPTTKEDHYVSLFLYKTTPPYGFPVWINNGWNSEFTECNSLAELDARLKIDVVCIKTAEAIYGLLNPDCAVVDASGRVIGIR